MKKTSYKAKIVKHKSGTPNPIIQSEEEMILATVDKALESSSNSQVIGRNGEIPLLNFLNRYLPFTLRAVTGHFMPPSGRLSPQIDIMIVDGRYPLLAENTDGTVLAMLHSVIQTIEVKTRITTRDIEKMWVASLDIKSLADEVIGYGGDALGCVYTNAIAYRSASGLKSLEKKYCEICDPYVSWFEISLLRLPNDERKLGFNFRFEAMVDEDENESYEGSECFYWPNYSFTPLSDIYYRLVQDSYYTLAWRNHQFEDIGRHIMNYMNWSTAPE